MQRVLIFLVSLFLTGCLVETKPIHIITVNDVNPPALKPNEQALLFKLNENIQDSVPAYKLVENQYTLESCSWLVAYFQKAPPGKEESGQTNYLTYYNWINEELKKYNIQSTNLNVDYILDINLLDYQYNTCYPDTSDTNVGRADVYISIQWTLRENGGREIFSVNTQGSNIMYQFESNNGVMRSGEKAYKMAVRNLINNEDFRALLTYTGNEKSTPKTQQVKNNNSAIKQSYAPLTINVDSAKVQTSQRSEWGSSVVSITKDGFDSSHGSGFIISEDLILTNQHVVGDSQYVTIKLADKDGFITLTDGEVIRVDEARDVALIKSRGKFKEKYFALNTILPKQGDDVFVIGSPLDIGLESTLTKGIVSHPNRIMEGLPFIQSDVNILGGNSGGPMIDMNGKVIGITVLGGTSEAQGINLFIPIKSALEALSIKTN